MVRVREERRLRCSERVPCQMAGRSVWIVYQTIGMPRLAPLTGVLSWCIDCRPRESAYEGAFIRRLGEWLEGNLGVSLSNGNAAIEQYIASRYSLISVVFDVARLLPAGAEATS